MPKNKHKEKDFPSLQRRIILYLSQHAPQNINETMKGIKGQYKSSWMAFKSLKRKSLIQVAEQSKYHGREFPRYWLTEQGVVLAISLGAEPQTLLRKTIEIHPENRDLHLLVEITPIVGKNALDVLRLAALTNGHVEQDDVDFLLARQLRNPFSPEVTKQFIKAMKKYPAQYQRLKDSVELVNRKVSELSDLIK